MSFKTVLYEAKDVGLLGLFTLAIKMGTFPLPAVSLVAPHAVAFAPEKIGVEIVEFL